MSKAGHTIGPRRSDTRMHDPSADYLAHGLTRNLRPTYLYHQRLMLTRLTQHLDERDIDLLDASTDDLEEYLDARKLSAASRRVEAANLRSFYSWAEESGLVARDPTRRLVRPRRPQSLPRPMPTADVRRALAEAPCAVAPILNFAVYAGLRASEIAQLRAEDIGTDPPMIRIRESKGGGESAVPIAPALAATLGRCPLPSSGWLFPAKRGNAVHLSRVRICQLANNYLHALGIEHTLHSLRHAYGTAIYRATRDLRLTQELMRHRSVQSTVGYTKLDPESGREAVSALRW
jgi:integrase/recombinase XerD